MLPAEPGHVRYNEDGEACVQQPSTHALMTMDSWLRVRLPLQQVAHICCLRHRLTQAFAAKVLCCVGLCCAVLCWAVLCCAVLCCAVLCCADLQCAVLCCAVLCCAVLCCAVSHRVAVCYADMCWAALCCAVL